MYQISLARLDTSVSREICDIFLWTEGVTELLQAILCNTDWLQK